MLSGGMLVALSGARQGGAVRMLIEHRSLLADIEDSWGRLVVTFPECRRLTFRSETPGEHESLDTVLAMRKPELCGARVVNDRVELHFRMGAAHGLIEVEAPDFELTLGGGRVLSYSEFKYELEHHECHERLDAV